MTYPLYQIVGQFDPSDREDLRIRLDDREFSFGGPDYVLYQNEPIAEGYGLQKHPDTGKPMLVATTAKA